LSIGASVSSIVIVLSAAQKKSHGRADINKQDAIGQRAWTQALLRFSNNDSIDVLAK
jgi:hypothetical protein